MFMNIYVLWVLVDVFNEYTYFYIHILNHFLVLKLAKDTIK